MAVFKWLILASTAGQSLQPTGAIQAGWRLPGLEAFLQGCLNLYPGKMRRYTPGEPSAWTMCGRISRFHTGVTAVRQSSQA